MSETKSMAKSSGDWFEPGDVSDARAMARNAAQWLARMTSSFATKDLSEDDNLQIYWDGESRRFLTPEVAPGTVLGLSLPGLILQFDERGAPSPHPFDTEGKSSTEVEAWLLCEMLHRNFDRDRFSKNLPYAWDGLMSGDEAKYAPEAHVPDLERLTTLLGCASKVLLQAEAARASAAADSRRLICWPETLDIGFVVPREAGGLGLEVGFGLGENGDGADFFVRPLAGTQRTFEPLSLPLADIVRKEMTNEEVAGDVMMMIKTMRASAAHE